VIEVDEFGWEALTAEAKRQGVSLEEIVYHAAMHYLACDRAALSYEVPRFERRSDPDPSDG
jgi:hypothetical protein